MEENNKPYTLSQYRQDQEKQNPYTLSQYRADQQDEPKFVDDEPITLSQYKEENLGPMGNLWRTFGGAGRDVAQATLDVGADTRDLMPERLRGGGLVWGDDKGVRWERREEFDKATKPLQLDTIPEPTYTGGSIVRDLSGFMVPYLGASKAIGGVKTIKGALGTGAVAEQFAFSPNEQRLSNLVESNPNLQNPFTEFLAADPDDPATLGRFKMALEGAGLGLAVESLMLGARSLRAKQKASSEIKATTKEANILKDTAGTEAYTGKIDTSKVRPPKPDSFDDYIKPVKDTKKQKPKKDLFKEVNVGVWTSKIKGKEYKIEIQDDGSFKATQKDNYTEDELEKIWQDNPQVEMQWQMDELRKAKIDRPIDVFETLGQAKRGVVDVSIPERLPSSLKITNVPRKAGKELPRVRSLFKGEIDKDAPEEIKILFGSSEGTRVVKTASGGDSGARKSVYNLPPAYINKEGTGLGRDGTVAYDSLKETLQDAGLLPPDIPGQPARGMEDEIIDILEKNDYIDRAAFDEWDIKKRDIDNKISRLEEAGHNPWKMSNDEVEEALSMIDVEDIRIEAGADEAAAIQRQRDEFNRANARLEEEFKAQGIRPQTLSDTIDTSTSVPMAIREQQALRMIEPEDTIANTSVEAIKQSRRAGNINLEKLDTPDDIKNFLRDVANNNDAFKAATRFGYKMGSKGEELKSLAEASGLTVDQLLKRKKGEAFNAETAYAARMILVHSAKELIAIAKKARGVNASNMNKIEFEKALATHAAIQEQVAGITAEAGRALRGFREMVDAEGAVQEKLIKDYMRQRGIQDGDTEAIQKVASAIADFDNVGQVSHFTKDIMKPGALDMIQEFWINALLSGPSTHIVNTTSNAIVAASRPFEYALASMIGAIKRNPDRITGGEVAARTFGTLFGAMDGLVAGTRALINPDSVFDPLTKLELRRQKSIPTLAGGGIVRLPGRALVAEDVLFKSIGYRQELWGLSIRQAKREGKGWKRAYEIMKDPDIEFPDIRIKALESGRYQTFTNALDTVGRGLQAAINKYPYARFIAPFIRTPVNIVSYAFERTPLIGNRMQRYKDAIEAGGAEADLARGKLILGSLVMGSSAWLALQGKITGRGPSDYRERSVLMATGWQPYSIKIGDTYYSYNRFEPVGIMLGISADLAGIGEYVSKEEEVELSEIAAMAIGSVSENISNKTFLTGISDVIDVLNNPDRYGDKAIERFLSSFIPTAAYYERKAADPFLRDVQTVSDAFVNRVSGRIGQQITTALPGVESKTSKDLPFRRNVVGEPKKYSPPAKFKHSPVRASKIKKDPVYEEFVRLGYTPTVPSRMSGSVKMNGEQYDTLLSYQQEVFMLRAQLEAVIKSAAYQRTRSAYAKKATLDEIIRKNQEMARQLLLVQYPDLIQQDIQSDLAEVLQ